MLGKETRKILEQLTMVSQLGLTMVGSIGLGFAIGFYLDKWLGTRGIFLTLFILLAWIRRLTFAAQALDLPMPTNEDGFVMVGPLTGPQRPCIEFLYVASQF